MSTIRANVWRRALESRLFLVFSFVLLRLILEAGYAWFVSPLYSYAGFYWDPSLLKYIESWVLLILAVFFAPVRVRSPSDYFVVFLLATVLLPVLSFYALANQTGEYVYLLLIGYATILVFRNGAPLALPVIKHGPMLAYYFSVIAVLIVSGWLVGAGGLEFFNLNLLRVYEFREASGEVAGRYGFQYFTVWATKVFGPFLLLIGLWRRRWWLVFTAISLHVFWFGVTAHKSVLFYPVLVFVAWFWVRKLPATGLVPLGMALVTGLSLVAYLIFGEGLLASLFIRRVFYVVGKLIFDYYTFFDTNPKVWWSNSLLSWALSYPYDMSPSNVIGEWNGTDSNANNSFLATAFMHGGVLGIFVYSIFIGFLLRLADSACRNGIPTWVGVGILVTPMNSLFSSSDLPTALLTHGIGVAFLLLILTRSSRPAPQAGMVFQTPVMGRSSMIVGSAD